MYAMLIGELNGSLKSLDLSHNLLKDPKAIEILASSHVPKLSLLRMVGNPLSRTLPNYRKVTIYKMYGLAYLDDSPVFEKERRLAVAFITGSLVLFGYLNRAIQMGVLSLTLPSIILCFLFTLKL